MKNFLLLIIIFGVVGCGGTPQKPAITTGFIKEPLTCNNGACDESDGETYYKHYGFAVDGNTFQAIIELGIRHSGLYQINMGFPFPVDIEEMHTTETVTDFCKRDELLGVESNWDGSTADGHTVRLLGSKFALSKDTDAPEDHDMPDEQVFFPRGTIVTELQNNTFIDLCSNVTVHWTAIGTIRPGVN